jgi:hypothetical protein
MRPLPALHAWPVGSLGFSALAFWHKSFFAYVAGEHRNRPIVSSAAQALVAKMATVRRVRPGDLLKLNLCNLDALTENYDLNFYLTYLMKWPSLFQCIEEHGKIVGYSTASP